MRNPRHLCSGALPACLGSALGRGVQGDVQVLCGRRGVGGALRNPQATPIPAKQLFSHQLLPTSKLTSLGASGYKICSTEKNVSGVTQFKLSYPVFYLE